MAESVYKVIELVGTSTESWDKAGKAAVERAAETLRDLRIAEVTEQDIEIRDGKVALYRVKLKVSFKFEEGGQELSRFAQPTPQMAWPAQANAERTEVAQNTHLWGDQ